VDTWEQENKLIEQIKEKEKREKKEEEASDDKCNSCGGGVSNRRPSTDTVPLAPRRRK